MGLQDGDDDVRAVAAAALLPVTEKLILILPQYVRLNKYSNKVYRKKT